MQQRRIFIFLLLLWIPFIPHPVSSQNITLYGEEEIYKDSTYLTAPCILKLSEKYFKSKVRSQGSLVIVNIKPDATPFQRNILNALNENEKHDLAIMVKDSLKKHWNASHVTEKAKNYFMLLNDKSELAANVKQLHALPTWNPLAQVVIFFLRVMEPEELEEQTIAVINELFNSSVLNVNVMSQRINSSVVQSYTWFPYEKSHCATKFTKLHLIDECEYVASSSSKERGGNKKFNLASFKSKWQKIPDEFHGCPLKIAAAKWEPFTHYSQKRGFYKGIEYFMISEAAHQMNFQPVFVLIDTEEMNYFGSLVNGTKFFNKIFTKWVLELEAEMMIGGLTENAESRSLLTSSVKYYQDDLTFCVANANRAPSWMNVFAIFDKGTWLFVLILLLSSSYLLWRVSFLDDMSQGNFFWGFLQGFALTLATYATYVPRKMLIRISWICITIYGMHFNVAYQSFLISVLTRPRFQTQVSSAAMAINAGFHFTGSENTFNFFLSNAETSASAKYIVEHFEICTDIDQCLARIATDDWLAVAVPREHSENSPLMNKRNMFCFSRSNNIYNFLISILARRDHHILPRMNRNIRGILEAGLLMKWQSDSQRDAAGTGSGSGSSDGGEESATIVLKIEHVQGAFFIAAIGLVVACLTFLAEIIVYRLSHTTTFRYLKCMENLFCYNSPRKEDNRLINCK